MSAPSRRNCEDAIRAVVAELHDEAGVPVVRGATPKAADRLGRWRLSPEEALSVYRIETDYRSKVAGLIEAAPPEAILGLKWKTIEEALGPEAGELDGPAFARAAELLEREETRRARVAALPRGYSCGELLATDFPPPQWIVPGLLVSGLTIFAGAPKLGKSWLALALGSAVGAGGVALGRYHVERRRAVYLALEDTPRRLKARLEKIGASPASSLEVFTQWRSGAEGLADLDALLAERVTVKLVIIDTLARFRGTPLGDDRYAADYAAAASIKEIADRHECAIVVIHHVRKATAEDVLDTVSGTNGLNGAADSTWVLTRARGEADATLFVTGRDVEETTLALRFDRDCGTWTALGDAEELTSSKERRDILRELEGGKEVKTGELAKALGKTPQAVSNRLRDLEAEGKVHSPRYGVWALAGRVSRETVKVHHTEDPPLTHFHDLHGVSGHIEEADE